MSANRTFLDTNIIVYAFDRSDPARQERASVAITRIIDNGEAVLSLQVLREFYVVVTRKLPKPLSHDAACSIIESLSSLRIVEDSIELLKEALSLVGEDRIPLWDAMIVAAASRAGCTRLYSEDFQRGRSVRGVRIVNPLVDDAE